jgi:hypothetical protein
MRLLAAVPLILFAGGTAWSYEVVVDAGAVARRDVVVSFALPEPGVVSWRLEDGAAAVALQVEGSQASFVVKDLPARATRTYTLQPGPGPSTPAVTATRDGDLVRFGRESRTMLSYISGRGPLPSGVPSQYRRAGYIQSVLTPRGRTITQDMPSDHRHHHGVWLAWTKTTIDGRSVDFWNMGQNKGGVQFESLDQVWSGPASAGLRARHRYINKTTSPATTALWESYLLRVYPGGGTGTGTYSLFDVEATHDRVGTTPMLLPTYHYGGIGYRAASEWNSNPSRMTVLTSEGRNRGNGDGTRARWIRISGTLGGQPAAIVIYGHPANFRAPQPLRVNPTDPFFCFAPSKLGDWSIVPGVPYLMRYRFAVYDEAPAVAEIERLWNDYADPPRVTVR